MKTLYIFVLATFVGTTVGIALNDGHKLALLEAQLDDARLQLQKERAAGCRVEYSIDGEHWTIGQEVACYPYMRVARAK